MRTRSIKPSGQAVRLGCLTLAVLVACHGDSATAPSNSAPATVTLVSGDMQRGEVGKELPNPLVARITDAKGHPAAGAVVNFRVVAGAGTVFAGTAQANRDGIVQERWTLGTTSADTQRVEVRAVDATTGRPLVYATFRAIGLAGPPASLASLSANVQSAPAGGSTPDSLRVRVLDRYGNGVPGAMVHFTPVPNAGRASPDSVASDSLGRAATRFTVGLRVGVIDSLAARVGALGPQWFLVSALLPRDARVALEGNNQEGIVGERLSNPLAIRITTAAGEPIAGVPVSWAAPAGQLVDPAAATGPDGVSAASYVLGTIAGAQYVTAAVDTQSYRFTETARPGAAVALRIIRPTWLLHGYAGMAPWDSIVVAAEDRFGNGVPSTPVTFAVSDEGMISPSTAQTNDIGTASALWILGTRVDSLQRLTISSPGLPSVGLDAETGIPLTARVLKIAGDSQSVVVGTAAADSLVAKVVLDDGRALRGAPVTWASNGDDIVSPALVNSGADGLARTRVVAGAHTGMATITATVSRLAPASFTEFRIAAPPASLTPLAGNDQVAVAGATLPDSLRIRVADRYGNIIQGAVVTWMVTDGSGFVSSPTSVTDANGLAAITWTLGNTLENTVTVTASGSSVSATFRATAITQVSSIAVGTFHSCLLTVEKAAVCWGLARSVTGIASNGTTTMLRVARGYRFQQIVPSYLYTCGLTDAGLAYCWGYNGYGRLGAGSDVEMSPEPLPVAGGHRFTSLAEGSADHMCGIADDGMGYCWGGNASGQLGIGSDVSSANVPTPIAGGMTWRALSVAGDYHNVQTCGVTTDGVGYCWGYYPSLTPAVVSSPRRIETEDSAIRLAAISADGEHACAISTAGTAYCLGYNLRGQLGRGTASDSYDFIARPVASAQSWTAIAAASDASCALDATGRAFCWGRAGYTATDPAVATRCSPPGAQYPVDCVTSPQPVRGGLQFMSISSGWGSTMTCGMATDHRAYCWGGTLMEGTTGPGTDTGEQPKRVMNQP